MLSVHVCSMLALHVRITKFKFRQYQTCIGAIYHYYIHLYLLCCKACNAKDSMTTIMYTQDACIVMILSWAWIGTESILVLAKWACYMHNITGKLYYYGQLHAHYRSCACHMHALHLLHLVHACVIHAFANDYYRMMMVIFFSSMLCACYRHDMHVVCMLYAHAHEIEALVQIQ